MYLEVSDVITLVSDKNNQEYHQASFRPVEEFLPSGKTIFAGDVIGKKLYNVGKAPQTGDAMKGKIQSFKTTPYQIGDRTVNTTTVVVFSNENPVDVANDQLESKNACVLDSNGKPTKVLELELTNEPVAGE